ncbi:MAG: hypothetical protein KBE09_01345 [Candidatus Pacebacteria bacterium]|nr:hypothetical protein [Candidatus Paceibacterota bacterium]
MPARTTEGVLHQLLLVQMLLLGGGTLFSTYTLFGQLYDFHALHGTIFRFADTFTQNPLLTPCFFGTCAFIIGFTASLVLLMRFTLRDERWLRNFLIFGVCFAALVLVYEACEYFKWIHFATSVSCAPGVHPLQSPCFTGFVFFILSALCAQVIVRKAHST